MEKNLDALIIKPDDGHYVPVLALVDVAPDPEFIVAGRWKNVQEAHLRAQTLLAMVWVRILMNRSGLGKPQVHETISRA